MWYRSKGVLQVKESNVTCSILVLGVFYNLIHDKVMFNHTVDPREECFLQLWIDEFVCCEECGETFSQDQMIQLSNTAGQCNHSEVRGGGCISFLVDEFDQGITPCWRVSAR